jgi:hypothetical protein
LADIAVSRGDPLRRATESPGLKAARRAVAANRRAALASGGDHVPSPGDLTSRAGASPGSAQLTWRRAAALTRLATRTPATSIVRVRSATSGCRLAKHAVLLTSASRHLAAYVRRLPCPSSVCVIDRWFRERWLALDGRRHRSRQRFRAPSVDLVDLAARSAELPTGTSALRSHPTFCGEVPRACATASSARRAVHSPDGRSRTTRHVLHRTAAPHSRTEVRHRASRVACEDSNGDARPLYRDCSPMNKVNRKFVPPAYSADRISSVVRTRPIVGKNFATQAVWSSASRAVTASDANTRL